jgi:RNA polymerase sigma-70 factor (ECF subfamily)
VRLYTPLVCYWCRKLDVPAQDIADVTQEVFRAVAASIHRFHRDRPGDTFRGWLRTITRSKVIDYIRARREEPVAAGGTTALFRLSQQADNLDDDDEGEIPLRNALFHDALQLIRSEFREPTWQAFWMVTVDGKSPQDAAAELGLSPGAVRVAKCRVLQRLRAVLLENTDQFRSP